MEKPLTLLIADRNPHVRRYLKREFTGPAYEVRTAEKAETVLADIYGPHGPDLLIVDPDLPDTPGETLLESLLSRLPPLNIIVHTLHVEDFSHIEEKGVFLVEKRGNSIERLKQIVSAMERRNDERLPASG